MRERLYLFDTTLRDGAQTNGVDFTLADKVAIIRMLYGAVEKLSASRGTAHLKVDASDSAREFFERKGFTAEQRNSVTVGNEWLSNTTMKKNLAANEDTP